MFRSRALTGSGAEPRPVNYGPTLLCPSCDVWRQYLRCGSRQDLVPGRAWRSPIAWEAICGSCGDEFTVS
jgi:hypothetical protein